MFSRFFLAASLVLGLAAPAVRAQQPDLLPKVADEPLLRLEAGGPTAFVTALTFSPDGTTLYAAGYDKVVRVWKLSAKTGQFELDNTATYRIPIGPSSYGAINAIAVSPDGTQLAVGG